MAIGEDSYEDALPPPPVDAMTTPLQYYPRQAIVEKRKQGRRAPPKKKRDAPYFDKEKKNEIEKGNTTAFFAWPIKCRT